MIHDCQLQFRLRIRELPFHPNLPNSFFQHIEVFVVGLFEVDAPSAEAPREGLGADLDPGFEVEVAPNLVTIEALRARLRSVGGRRRGGLFGGAWLREGIGLEEVWKRFGRDLPCPYDGPAQEVCSC